MHATEKNNAKLTKKVITLVKTEDQKKSCCLL